MLKVEFCTWSTDGTAEKAAEIARRFRDENKHVVAVGEWGVKTFLVIGAESKEEAKQFVIDRAMWKAEKVKCRDVTKCKKYQ